jgi:hypothetical protein
LAKHGTKTSKRYTAEFDREEGFLDRIKFRDLTHEFGFFIIHKKFFSCLWSTVFFIEIIHWPKHGTKTSKYHTAEFDLEEGFLNGACIGISNLPENIA